MPGAAGPALLVAKGIPLNYHSNEMSYVEANIRPALANDARSIAEVHVGSWKTTYTGIFPDTLLESLSIDSRERSWKETLAEPRLVTLVGCDAGDKVVVFICGAAERAGQLRCDGELHAIYILQIAQDKAWERCWYADSCVGLGYLVLLRWPSGC